MQALVPEKFRRCSQFHQMLHSLVVALVIGRVHANLISHWVIHANTLWLKSLVFTFIVAHIVALIQVILHVILALRTIPSHQKLLRHWIAEGRTNIDLIVLDGLLSILYQVGSQWILRIIFHGQTSTVYRGGFPNEVVQKQCFLRLEEYWGRPRLIFVLRILKSIHWVLKSGQTLLLLFKGRSDQFRFVIVASFGIEALEGRGST